MGCRGIDIWFIGEDRGGIFERIFNCGIDRREIYIEGFWFDFDFFIYVVLKKFLGC